MVFADIITLALETGREGLSRADRLRHLNDTFRRTFSGGNVVVSRGVMLLAPDDRCALFQAVREYDSFKPEDDPFGEHEFGAVVFKNQRFFWCIDYYDLDLRRSSPDPTDPAFTVRIMTIVLGGEY